MIGLDYTALQRLVQFSCPKFTKNSMDPELWDKNYQQTLPGMLETLLNNKIYLNNSFSGRAFLGSEMMIMIESSYASCTPSASADGRS